MSKVNIRMGGYGPATTSFSRALQLIADRLEKKFPDDLDVKIVWNIMDLGYRSEDIIWLVEDGILSLGYQSSSYFTEMVPDLGFADLPFLFTTTEEARAAMDGQFGELLAKAIEKNMDLKILGWFENGFRHISNKKQDVLLPEHMSGLSIRVLPSKIHERTFELLGAKPWRCDLTEAIAAIKAGEIDAQENPLSNTVTYGVHNFHPHVTLTGHFYVSRPIFLNKKAFETWPGEVQEEMILAIDEAVAFQRGETAKESDKARQILENQGCKIVELDDAQKHAFQNVVAPQIEEARKVYSQTLFDSLNL